MDSILEMMKCNINKTVIILCLCCGTFAQIRPHPQGQEHSVRTPLSLDKLRPAYQLDPSRYYDNRPNPPIDWQREGLLPVNATRTPYYPQDRWGTNKEYQYDGSGLSKQEQDQIKLEMMNKAMSLRESKGPSTSRSNVSTNPRANSTNGPPPYYSDPYQRRMRPDDRRNPDNRRPYPTSPYRGEGPYRPPHDRADPRNRPYDNRGPGPNQRRGDYPYPPDPRRDYPYPPDSRRDPYYRGGPQRERYPPHRGGPQSATQGTKSLLPFIDPDLPDGLDTHYELMQQKQALEMMGHDKLAGDLMKTHLDALKRQQQLLKPTLAPWPNRRGDSRPQTPGQVSGRASVYGSGHSLQGFEGDTKQPSLGSEFDTKLNMSEFVGSTGRKQPTNLPPPPNTALSNTNKFSQTHQQHLDAMKQSVLELRNKNMEMQVELERQRYNNGLAQEQQTQSGGQTGGQTGGQGQVRYTDVSHGLRAILQGMNVKTNTTNQQVPHPYYPPDEKFPGRGPMIDYRNPQNLPDPLPRHLTMEQIENIREGEMRVPGQVPGGMDMRYMTGQRVSKKFVGQPRPTGGPPPEAQETQEPPVMTGRGVWQTPEGQAHLRQDAMYRQPMTQQQRLLGSLGRLEIDGGGEVEMNSKQFKQILADIYRRGVMASQDGAHNPYRDAVWSAINGISEGNQTVQRQPMGGGDPYEQEPQGGPYNQPPRPGFYQTPGDTRTRVPYNQHPNSSQHFPGGWGGSDPYNRGRRPTPYPTRQHQPLHSTRWPSQQPHPTPMSSRAPPNTQTASLPHMSNVRNAASMDLFAGQTNKGLNPMLNFHDSDIPGTSRVALNNPATPIQGMKQTNIPGTIPHTARLPTGNQPQGRQPATSVYQPPNQSVKPMASTSLQMMRRTGFMTPSQMFPVPMNTTVVIDDPVAVIDDPVAVTPLGVDVKDKARGVTPGNWDDITPPSESKQESAAKLPTNTNHPFSRINRPGVSQQTRGRTTSDIHVPNSWPNARGRPGQIAPPSATQHINLDAINKRPSTMNMMRQMRPKGGAHASLNRVNSDKNADYPAKMMASVSDNMQTVTERLTQEPVTEDSVLATPVSASSAFGIFIGVVIGMVVIMGPIACIAWKVRQRSVERKKKKMAAEADKSQEAGLMEAMIMSELRRPSVETKPDGSGAKAKIRCDSNFAHSSSEIQALTSKTTTAIVH